MQSTKKTLLKSILTGNAGCGCGRPKLSDVYEPTPMSRTNNKPPLKNPQNQTSSSSSSSCCNNNNKEEEDCTSTTITTAGTTINNHDLMSCNTTSSPHTSESDKKSSKIEDSIAVVKDSNNPYQDFRHSMLQMIFEKEIYSGEELQDLLDCFLELNSPCHHDVIVKAFTEIWNEVISKPSS
ncbi:hypothetical protein Tsubulata_020134 [Turnera subulata]|uniref:Transcription repressor n=1 Tax=Turnera subulata TaxID=218843 RepID=A0A9Q0G234_9ROSI|nr:hypothetical protein Tsubulata_020134 [Turnera subulata]